VSESPAAPALIGRRVVLLRHGRTEWNTTGRWQGHLDSELDETGWEQAERAARLLAVLRPNLLISSDLHRARSTAEVLARTTGLELRQDSDLRETCLGEWQGLSSADIARRWPRELAVWQTGDVSQRPPGGENRLEVAARMTTSLRKALAEVPDGGTLVAVTHGGAARVAIAAFLELEERSWGSIGGLSNCNWSLLGERAGQPDQPVRWRLLEHNAGSLPEPLLTEEG
jgi:broad specificity phosphatase PhoE